jgi:3-hydroxyisobutyrate dehydrogenase
MKIGFVGLGNMGAPMARNLARAGFALVVRDLDPERQQEIAVELAATPADGPAAFADADAVVTMLPTSREVRDVLLGWGLADALPEGAVVVDMSSSSPTVTRELGPVLAERGVALVDAPVSGGVPRAESATLTIMIGGDDADAIERARPVLEALGERLFRTGPLGSGHATKALNNYVAAACYTAAAEAVIVGARFGLDPADLVEVINASTGRSFQTETNFPGNVLERRFASGFALGLLAKDVGIAAELAEQIGVRAPLCELTSRLWHDAELDEGAAADHTAAIRHWERLNGVEPSG